MKNKKMVYILIPVVLIIWGYIGFKILNYGEEEDDIEPIKIGEIITGNQNKPEAKTLALNYPDPFLKGVRNVSQNKGVKVKKMAPKKVVPVNWGNITYNGFVKNQKNSKKIALMNINGKQTLAGKGEQIQQISILSIQQDSVLLEMNNNRKWFKKFSK